jgi:hypothetical protein
MTPSPILSINETWMPRNGSTSIADQKSSVVSLATSCLFLLPPKKHEDEHDERDNYRGREQIDLLDQGEETSFDRR